MRFWNRRAGGHSQQGESAREQQIRRLESQWGVEICASCGRTLVLGDHVRKVSLHGARATVCEECYQALTHPPLEHAA